MTTVGCNQYFLVLQALGIQHIDYFSLDVEGLEADILSTMHLSFITIDVLTVEYATMYRNESYDKTKAAIRKVLEPTHIEITEHNSKEGDVYFVRRGLGLENVDLMNKSPTTIPTTKNMKKNRKSRKKKRNRFRF